MLTALEGVYRDGKIELAEKPINVPDDTRVVVTFLNTGPVDLRSRGIGKSEAAELRDSLSTFAEEWERPEMGLYDHYDAVKTTL